MIKKSAPLAPFDLHNTPHVHLRIYTKGSGFGAEIRINGRGTEIFTIPLTPLEVEEINCSLQYAIQCASGQYDATGVSDDALAQLASAGQAAFNRIFAVGKPRETIRAVLEILQGVADPTIEIASERFFLPWELLYHGTLTFPIDISSFWGMRYVLSRIIIQEDNIGALVSPVIEASRPCVGLITCDELPYVVAYERPLLQKLHKMRHISLSLLRPLEVGKHHEELTYFGRFLSKRMHITHLACHAYMQDPLDLSFLRLSHQFDVTMRDLYAQEFIIRHHPLVILNACHTGTIHPASTSSWAALFWRYGARGVLATEFRVPDDFAAAFIEELYQNFLAGKPIGSVLLILRRSFWERQQNPLGLAYALYSPSAVRIVHKS